MELFRILQQKKEQLPNTIVPFSDILARLCFVLECTPGDIIKYNFIAYIAVISMLFLTITGLDRMIPNFGLPSEPKVKLKKF